MRLIVVQNGRIKDRHVLALRRDYEQRFRRYGQLDIIEASPRGTAGLWPARADWRILVDERGAAWGSAELATRLADWSMHRGTIALAIGAAFGHDAATRDAADAVWSLGTLVLPHQLAHLLVVEQLYRAATILAGTAYHHA